MLPACDSSVLGADDFMLDASEVIEETPMVSDVLLPPDYLSPAVGDDMEGGCRCLVIYGETLPSK